MGLTPLPSSSTAPHCADLREAYHACFNKWYSEKFSKCAAGKEEPCVAQWDTYRACLARHLEDKHLARMLVEAEAAVYLSGDDSGGRGAS